MEDGERRGRKNVAATRARYASLIEFLNSFIEGEGQKSGEGGKGSLIAFFPLCTTIGKIQLFTQLCILLFLNLLRSTVHSLHFEFQAFIATGFNLVLSFDTFTHALHPPERRQIDFEKDPGKVNDEAFLCKIPLLPKN